MLQKITTKEPDESMVEVAIAAVEAVFDWEDFLKEKDYRQKIIYALNTLMELFKSEELTKYIEDNIREFSSEGFRMVCFEYLNLLNKFGKITFSSQNKKI